MFWSGTQCEAAFWFSRCFSSASALDDKKVMLRRAGVVVSQQRLVLLLPFLTHMERTLWGTKAAAEAPQGTLPVHGSPAAATAMAMIVDKRCLIMVRVGLRSLSFCSCWCCCNLCFEASQIKVDLSRALSSEARSSLSQNGVVETLLYIYLHAQHLHRTRMRTLPSNRFIRYELPSTWYLLLILLKIPKL
jgi:hypothetical protein